MIRPGRLAGAFLVGTLGVALVALRPPTTPEFAPSATTEAVGESAPLEEAVTLSSVVATTDSAAPVATSTTKLARGPSAVVAEGLRAWGRFAVHGDLDIVSPWFDPGGPQFERFRTEARRGGVGGKGYTVMLRDATETLSGETADVSGRVVFSRTGEPSQVFNWNFSLSRHGGSWMIWTISDASP